MRVVWRWLAPNAVVSFGLDRCASHVEVDGATEWFLFGKCKQWDCGSARPGPVESGICEFKIEVYSDLSGVTFWGAHRTEDRGSQNIHSLDETSQTTPLRLLVQDFYSIIALVWDAFLADSLGCVGCSLSASAVKEVPRHLQANCGLGFEDL